MSDLLRGNPPGSVPASARPGNGGPGRTSAAGESGPTPTGPPRYRTPTDVMRDRRAREARRAEEAARQRQSQEEEERRRQQERVVGVGDDPTRRNTRRTSNPPTQSYNIAGPSTQPASTQRRPENVPPDSAAGPSRQRDPAVPTRVISANTQRNRTEAYEQLNVPAPSRPTAGRPDQPSQGQQPPVQPTQQPPQTAAAPQPAQTNPQPGTQPATGQNRSRFPNAFDRWEDLSSHWEGIVSSFLRKLQNNEDELAGRPIDRQMARQIEDLSAAGANLFHAVVELQRLRASSERKFQRWFFETRHEQEQAQARQEELERQLAAEREARTHSSTSIEAARAEKSRAEELAKEMRRELQISKEEARRAWEELGRREQEERERTIALRSGEATLIGGVQVVPMQGLPSRQVSSVQRPQTRDGPTAAAGPSTLSGQGFAQQIPLPQRPPSRSQTTTTSLDSPGEESRQFSYQPSPGNSPTVTDPYTEGSRRREPQSQTQQLGHEPDTQFYSSPPRQPPQVQPSPSQPPTSAAAIAAARAVAATSHLPTPIRSGTSGTDRSYIPSTASAASDEEYHINPDGSYTRDDQGRRIPYDQPLRGPVGPSALSGQLSGDEGEITEEEEDDDDHAADLERERMYAAQYRQAHPSQPPLPSTTQQQGTSATIPRTTSGALPPIPQGRPIDATSAEYDQQGYTSPPDWESIGVQTPHRHPTRLSDIIEEQTARTSPSRTSYVSGQGLPGDGMPPSTVAGGSSGSRR